MLRPRESPSASAFLSSRPERPAFSYARFVSTGRAVDRRFRLPSEGTVASTLPILKSMKQNPASLCSGEFTYVVVAQHAAPARVPERASAFLSSRPKRPAFSYARFVSTGRAVDRRFRLPSEGTVASSLPILKSMKQNPACLCSGEFTSPSSPRANRQHCLAPRRLHHVSNTLTAMFCPVLL